MTDISFIDTITLTTSNCSDFLPSKLTILSKNDINYQLHLAIQKHELGNLESFELIT